MHSFAEWLQKNHNVLIEDLRERTRGEGGPLRGTPQESKEDRAEFLKHKAEDAAKKKILRARTRGEGNDAYSRLRK